MNLQDLRDGTVVELKCAIKNPEKDRRVTRDWTREEAFKPGRYIIGEEWIGDHSVLVITREGDEYRTLHRITPRHPCYGTFLMNCQPAEESLTSVLDVLNMEGNADEILDYIVRTKMLSLADVKRAATALKDEWREELAARQDHGDDEKRSARGK